MNNNKFLYVIIGILVLIIIGGGFFFFSKNTVNNNEPSKNESPVAENTTATNLSEQPDKAKYNEYFTGAYLAKLPAGAEFNPWKIIKTNVFALDEQFCTSIDMKKQISANTLSSAVYDVNTKQDVMPRGGTFPQAMGPGNSTGCQSLVQSVGKYEFKIYVNDDLVIILPFEVK